MNKLITLIKKNCSFSNPLFVFTFGLILGAIFFMLSPAFRDSSEPTGVFGMIGYIIWGATLLMFFLGKFIFKSKK